MATRRRASRSSITGTITDLQRRVKYLQSLPSPTRLANQVVRRVNIQPRAVNSDQIALNAVTNDQVAADAIKLENMDQNSVDTGQIVENAITRIQILDGEVVTSKIGDLNVTTGKLANGAVNAGKLANASVEENKIAGGAVTNAKIANNAVNTVKISDSAISTPKISTSAVTADKLATSAVTNAKIGGGAVTSAKLATGAVTETKIASNAVTGSKIANNAVTASKITAATRLYIVSENLRSGQGLLRSNNQLRANFGTSSTQVARGNHSHTLGTSTQNFRVVLVGGTYTLAGSNHRHSVSSSSKRYKKNITHYEFEGPEKLLNLAPVKYQYKRSKRENHQVTNKEWAYGYIAEDVLAAGVHEVVAYTKDGEVEGIDYGLLSVFVLELVKKQQNEIESLRQEVAKLRSDNGN